MKKCLFILGFAMLFLSGCSNYQYDIFGSVSGVVTDNATGNPIDNVSITIVPGANSVTTTSDGKFEFVNLEEGQYTISAQKSGYQSNRKNVTVVSGESVNANITLTEIPKN